MLHRPLVLRVCSIVVLVCGIQSASKAQPAATFIQFGTSSVDSARGISTTANAVYVAGSTEGTFPGQTNVRWNDAFVRKYDRSGVEIWTRQFGSDSNDHATAVSATNSGAVYVVGYTEGALPGQLSAGGEDVFVRKYDRNGVEMWTRQFGSSSWDEAYGVAAMASGEVYVAGRTNGSLPGQINAGQSDAFVRKYDADGTELWTRQFGSVAHDTASGLSAVANTVYVTGNTSGALPGQVDNEPGAFLRKYDGNGIEHWTRQFGDPTAGDIGYAVVAVPQGVYVTGYTLGALPGQTSAGQYDAFVLKYDEDGTELWTRQFGTDGRDGGFGLSEFSGDLYVVGVVEGSLPGFTLSGSADAFIRKYDRNGAEIWTSQFGSNSSDVAFSVGANAGDIYILGYTWGDLPGQTSLGPSDAFLAILHTR